MIWLVWVIKFRSVKSFEIQISNSHWKRWKRYIYIASCPALQGCYSQGDTVDEALQNIKDAIQLHIEARQALGEPIPIEILIDEVEVVV